MPLDASILDSADRLIAGDPGEMLRAVATSGAQVRAAAAHSVDAHLEQLALDGRPRAVVVLGMGSSGMAGDALAAVAGHESPVPIFVHRGYGLPGWVGAADLVCGVSSSGTTEETLSGFEEALRRGARLLGVGAADSPLAFIAERGRAPFVPVRTEGRPPRSLAWSLTIPLLVAAAELGIADCTPRAIEAAAARLDETAILCRPASEAFVNPGKELALALADSLPMVWGCSGVAAAAAYRMGCQWNENAKLPLIAGSLPEADHNQLVALDGSSGGGEANDIFADPDGASGRLHLVLLRDLADEHPQVTRRAEISKDIAEARGVRVTELRTEGDSRVERLASLIGLIDYGSVYTALGNGLDPSPIVAIQDLKYRLAY